MADPSTLVEMRYKDRPKCGVCGVKMKYTRLRVTPNFEVYGWEFDCDCIDVDRLAPDITYTLIDGGRIS